VAPEAASGAVLILTGHLSDGSPITTTITSEVNPAQVEPGEPFSYDIKQTEVLESRGGHLDNCDAFPSFTNPLSPLEGPFDTFSLDISDPKDGPFAVPTGLRSVFQEGYVNPVQQIVHSCTPSMIDLTQVSVLEKIATAPDGIGGPGTFFPPGSKTCLQLVPIFAGEANTFDEGISGKMAQIALGGATCEIDNSIPPCTDGKDNDGDGKVDYPYDTDCEAPTGPDEGPSENPPNHPPNCPGTAKPVSLWPPNHKFRLISLDGINDPDGDRLQIIVTGVTQDEPVNGLGDGDTTPDAKIGPAPTQVYLRSERSGLLDGRVYRINYTASDSKGASCTGIATVGVPHDQGKGKTPIDSDPPGYDSFGP
jgi:hypothetical protein